MMKLSLTSTQDCNLLHVYSQYQYVPLEITFIYRLVADGTFPPLFVSLMGTIKKHQVSTARHNHSERFTITHLPGRDSAAHMTSSIHGHSEISWLKEKKREFFYDKTPHVGDREIEYFRCISGMLTYLLLVDRDISDRKEFDDRIASEGQSKITHTHTHTHASHESRSLLYPMYNSSVNMSYC